MRLTEFIDTYAELIDSKNTYDLLFYANMNLSDEDISKLTRELDILGLNILEHLKKDNDEVRLFSDDFTLRDLQEYLNKNFKLEVDIKDYSKYNLNDMFELLEKYKYDLDITISPSNLEPFQYIDLYLDRITISVIVTQDIHYINVSFITTTNLFYKINLDLEHDAFSLNSAVGYTLNRNTLKDTLASVADTLKDFFNSHLA